MAKIKFDVSNSDPEKALQNFEQPKPAIYRAKVAEINPGFSKTDGKEDKKKPRLEVIYQITDEGDYKGSKVWDYVTFTPESAWKMDQFLQAFGVASKSVRKGTFDTDELVGKPCKVRVVAGKRNGAQTSFGDDDYRADVGRVMPAGAGAGKPSDDESPFGEGDDDNLFGEGDDDAGGDETGEGEDAPFGAGDDEEGDGEGEGDGEDAAAETDDGYDDMSIPELRKELKARELVTTGAKPALIARLRENDAEEEPF